jgi:predicted pyridoxine 5'-phosphate oxidase superfamily flavin-nucleotide-binding protein
VTNLPEVVNRAWEDRNGPAVFGTVSDEGVANLVYVGAVWKLSDDRFLIADNYFHKTQANIFAGSKGSLLFLTSERKSYQVKGSIDYYTSGEIYETMKRWDHELNPDLPAVGATVLNVEEVYRGSQRLV